MTIGSAAFLPGPAPAPLLPSFKSFQPEALPDRASPRLAAPGLAAPGLAANDWPYGRILVAGSQAILAFDLQRFLRDAGYRIVGPAATVAEASRLVDCGQIDGAVVDLDLEPSAARPIVGLLEDAGIPTVLLSGASLEELPERHRHQPLVEKPYTRTDLLAAIRRAMAPTEDDGGIQYRVSPSISWPRVFPQL